MLNLKKISLESFLKKYQLTFSILFSLLALYFSFTSYKLSKSQYELSNKASFSFNINYDDSSQVASSIDFFSLKNFAHLETIEIIFPDGFTSDNKEVLNANRWYLQDVASKTVAYLIRNLDPKYNNKFYLWVRHEIMIPIIATFNFVEYGEKKSYSAFYLLDTHLHNYRKATFKNLLFQKEITVDSHSSQFLDNYFNEQLPRLQRTEME